MASNWHQLHLPMNQWVAFEESHGQVITFSFSHQAEKMRRNNALIRSRNVALSWSWFTIWSATANSFMRKIRLQYIMILTQYKRKNFIYFKLSTQIIFSSRACIPSSVGSSHLEWN